MPKASSAHSDNDLLERTMICPARGSREAGARLGAVLALTLLAAVGGAQEPKTTVRGKVENARGDALSAATVEVLTTRWRTTTAHDGTFSLALSPGRWTLRTTHIGYRADTLALVVESGATQAIIRLTDAPAQLLGITVAATPAPAMSRSVTRETVRQVPPLAEPDVFRAVALQPSVSQPNDITGRLHLAGGASDETAVTLDGYPLQQPFHLFGVLGVFNTAALERADVLVHHVPSRVGGGVSGVIDLQTRQPASEAKESVVSLLSSSLTINDAQTPWGVDVLASGRVTYVDKLTALTLAPTSRIKGEEVPLIGYEDAVVRLGRSLGAGTRVELLGFGTRDHLRSLLDAGQEPLIWAEGLAGLRIAREQMRWSTEVAVSADRASVRLDSSASHRIRIDNDRRVLAARGSASRRGVRTFLDVGASAESRTYSHSWMGRSASDILTRSAPDTFANNSAHTEVAMFAEITGDATKHLSATLGTRATSVGDRWHIGPRGSVEARVRRLTLQIAVERRHQFTAEAEDAREGNVAPPVFLLSTPREVDARAVAIGTEPLPWAGGTLELRAEAFHRTYRNRVLLDDSALVFPAFSRVNGHSRGASATFDFARDDGYLVHGSYTYARVIESGSLRAVWDTPHDLSFFGAAPLRGPWSLTAAFRGRSGQVLTPLAFRVFMPTTRLNGLDERPVYGERNSARAEAYQRLDLGLRRPWRRKKVNGVFFLQVVNVLNHRNVLDYDLLDLKPAGGGAMRPSVAARGGLPILPSIGVEISW